MQKQYPCPSDNFSKYKRKFIPKIFMLASMTLVEMHNNYLPVWSSSFKTSMDCSLDQQVWYYSTKIYSGFSPKMS